MDFNSHVSGDKIKWTVVFLLCVAFLACIIALFVRINRVDTTKDLSATAYTVGTLTTSGGTETESDHALRTDLLKVEDFICIKV